MVLNCLMIVQIWSPRVVLNCLMIVLWIVLTLGTNSNTCDHFVIPLKTMHLSLIIKVL